VEFSAEKNMKWQVEVPRLGIRRLVFGATRSRSPVSRRQAGHVLPESADGRELWRVAAPAEKIEGAHRIGSPATPTCCTDGER
jgi:outer membrane protein assembly factor BamB